MIAQNVHKKNNSCLLVLKQSLRAKFILQEAWKRTLQVRRLNFYHDGDATPYGQIQPTVHISRCWDILIEKSDYSSWRASVDHFNK